MTYYKAVQPDGTDFYTGTVRWLPVGELRRARTVKHPTSTQAVRGDHSTSLAVSDDPTRLPGASWPMRLAEVEPVPGVEVIDCRDHKHQSTQWRVVREVHASLRFGVQGEHVASLVDRASRITATEARDLHAARDAAWHAARHAAGDAAWDAARDAARDAAWHAAGHAAGDAAWDAAGDAAGDAARYAAGHAAWDAAWYAAWDAAWYAAWALVVRNLIGSHGFTRSHYDTLTAPWRKVIGPVHPDDPAL